MCSRYLQIRVLQCYVFVEMGDEVKKISFGFSKLAKKTSIVSSKLSQAKPELEKVEFIDCLEGKSIKLKDPVKSEKTLLVIPLKRQIGLEEDISSVEQDIKTNSVQSVDLLHDSQDNSLVKPPATNSIDCVPSENIEDGKLSGSERVPSLNLVKNETLSLDEIAEREILEEISRKKTQEEARIFSVPLTSNAPTGEKESSLEDYDNIPVNDFGMAMLRGMGWAPGKGIGKNEKLITPSVPILRPKGMGLGADQVIKAAVNKSISEDLKMTKGGFIRVIAGPYQDSYGEIEGFDDESCRLIVKLVLKNMSVSLNEFMVQLVDKIEFTKNSKVINVGKYEKYKDDEGKTDLKKEKSEEISWQQKPQQENLFSHDRYVKHNEKSSDKSKPNKSDKYNKCSSSSESDFSNRTNTATKVNKFPPTRKSGDKSYKGRSRSPEDKHRISGYSRSPSKSSIAYSRSSTSSSKLKHHKSAHKEKSLSSPNSRHRLGSSDRTSNSSDNSSSNNNWTKKKKPSSRKKKSRSRSRSPRKHSNHKKHKKSKYN